MPLAARRAADAAGPDGRAEDAVVALRVALPLDRLPRDVWAVLRLAPPGAPRFAWRAYDAATTRAAFGAVRTVRGEGEGALEAVGRAVAAAAPRRALPDGRPAAGPPARWYGGAAFDVRRPPIGDWAAFPAVAFSLPEVELAYDPRRQRATLTVCGSRDALPELAARAGAVAHALRQLRANGDADPDGRAGARGPDGGRVGAAPALRPDPALAERLARAIDAIAAGRVAKVVVAASRRAPGPAGGVAALFARAVAAPRCTAYLVAPAPDAAWLGATPERLVRVRGRRGWSMALAGTRPRGADAAADRRLGAALRASDKDRREHAAVVEGVRGALAAVPGVVTAAPGAPRLRRLATLQHLETPIAIRGAQRLDILALAARLHPTPALCGAPAAAARDLIAHLEPEGRGWYGGLVGWVDGRGDGDLAVGIRGLLVSGGRATAWAGAGLVAGSDAAAEADEIAHKLAAALALLDGGAGGSTRLETP